MEVSREELRQHYAALSTDELLAIRMSGELTEMASSLLDEQLARREVTPEDHEHARHAQTVIEADRESIKRDISRGVRRLVVILLFIAMVSIYFWFLA